MTIEAWITLAVVVGVVVVLAREALSPALTVLFGTSILFLLGIIDGDRAFSGFSSEAPIAVGALLVLARAVDMSGVMQPIVRAVFGSVSDRRAILARLVFPVAGASAFLNNTTLVAMTVPTVLELTQRRQLAPSRFLIPVSYAAVLGGVITAIGTSTNLTVSGLLRESGQPPLGLFELTPVGLPIAVAGCIAMVFLAGRLLPDRGSAPASMDAGGRDFTVTMRVVPGAALDGASVLSGGLRQLRGVFLIGIERGDHEIAPVSPEERLEGGDLLTFVGRVDDIVDLQRMPGLVSSEASHLTQLDRAEHQFYEVVVGAESDLVGRDLREIGFRARYQAAVLAIHRAGQRIDEKLGQVPLRMGDTLLVLADSGFRDRWRDSRDFLLVAPLSGIPPTQSRKAPLVAAITVGFIVLTGLGFVPLLQGAMAVALLIVATRVLTVRQARDAIDLDIVVLIAASFGLGAAVESTGLGQVIADGLLGLTAPLGTLGALAGILLATMALTELISNNAAAVLLFPVALATAATVGADARPFVIAVTLGASLSFLTPIGYQTNLMVYGLGGYRFLDYTRLGIPLNIVCVVLSLTLLPVVFPFHPA